MQVDSFFFFLLFLCMCVHAPARNAKEISFSILQNTLLDDRHVSQRVSEKRPFKH